MNNLDSRRVIANTELVRILEARVQAHPSQRFGQILRNNNFIRDGAEGKNGEHLWHNAFNDEPEVILERVRAYLRGDLP